MPFASDNDAWTSWGVVRSHPQVLRPCIIQNLDLNATLPVRLRSWDMQQSNLQRSSTKRGDCQMMVPRRSALRRVAASPAVQA